MREIIPGLLYEMNSSYESPHVSYQNCFIIESNVFEKNKSYFLKNLKTSGNNLAIIVLGNLARDRCENIHYYGYNGLTIFDPPATTIFRILLKRHRFEDISRFVFYGDSFKWMAFAHNCSFTTKTPIKYFDTTDAFMKTPRIVGQLPTQYKREYNYALLHSQIYEEKMNGTSPFNDFQFPEGKTLVINFIAPPGYNVVAPAMSFPKWFNSKVSKDRLIEFVERKKYKGLSKKLIEKDINVVTYNVLPSKLHYENENIHVIYVFMDIPFIVLQYYLMHVANVSTDSQWCSPNIKKIASWYNNVLDKPHSKPNNRIIYYYPKNALPDTYKNNWPDFHSISKYKPVGYQFFTPF